MSKGLTVDSPLMERFSTLLRENEQLRSELEHANQVIGLLEEEKAELEKQAKADELFIADITAALKEMNRMFRADSAMQSSQGGAREGKA